MSPHISTRVRAENAPAPSLTRMPVRMLQRKCACGGTVVAGGECAQCRKKRLQRKLAVNQPGDRFEQEADRMAEFVVSGGRKAPALSNHSLGILQREEPKTPPKPDNYDEAISKILDALKATPVAKELQAKAAEMGKDFISSVEGKVIAGSALGGALAAIIATNSKLPMQIPELPLDFIAPGLKAKITWEGPAQSPTNAGLVLTTKSGVSVGASYTKTPASGGKPAEEKAGLTLTIPLGGSSEKKKGGRTPAEKYRAETAKIAAEQEKFRQGMKTPGDKTEDKDFVDAYVRSKVDPTNPLGLPPLKKKEDLLLMRKSPNKSLSALATAPPIVHDVLESSGEPLDADSRRFFEERFGYDFGAVRVHRDVRAAESARAVHAQAYTVGHDIVFDSGGFAPQTETGRRLLAHELTHVVQQTSAGDHRESAAPPIVRYDLRHRVAARESGIAPSLRRKPGPVPPVAAPPFYQEVLDALAVERKQIITIVRSQIIPESIAPLEKLLALCKAIEQERAADIPAALTDFFASGTDHLPLVTPSPGLVAEMTSRMMALGLSAESQKLRQWGVAREKNVSPGYYEHYEAEIYAWQRIKDRLLERIPDTGGANALKSLDALLLFFKQLHQERFALDEKAIEKDQKRRADLFDNYFVQREKTISVYAAELVAEMREVFIGIQTAFQVMLDEAVDDLAHGRGSAMLEKAKERLENQLLSLIEPKDKEKRVTGIQVETTRSEFGPGGGRHFDYFARTEAAKKKRSIKVEFYDVEQQPSLASEMKGDLGGVFLARRRQIALIEEIYGLQKDDKGQLTAETKENAAAIAKLGATGFQLHTDDDWRKFVKEKFELREATDGPEKALVAVMDLLGKYFKIFTTHTPYNIEDFGDNLLTKTFPRDMAGRLIHDCGVYALRVAYILSLLRDHPKLKLRFRYAVMPLHVGLIITGDNLPLFLVNNDSITRYSASDLAAMRAQWDQRDEKGEIAAPAKPATEARFVGEMAADAFISGVDIPYKEIEVTKLAGSPAAMKAQLWQQYTTAVAPSADKLFGPSVKDPKSPNYQFYLRYLKLLGLVRDFHNNFLVQFWNVTANEIWDRHQQRILQAATALQQATGHRKAAAQKTYDEAAKKYMDELDAAFQDLEQKYQPVTLEQIQLQTDLHAHPEVFSAGSEVESSDRVRSMFEALGQGGTWWENAIYDHLRDVRTGTVKKAPFAGPENKLFPVN